MGKVITRKIFKYSCIYILFYFSFFMISCNEDDDESDSGTDIEVYDEQQQDNAEQDTGSECSSELDCTDYIYCNGIEKCDNGYCVAGEPILCDDGFECTYDHCDEQTNSCVYTPDDELCQDNNPCNGEERCVPWSEERNADGCISGTPKFCDDGDDCTDDFCDPQLGECRISIKDFDQDNHGDRNCSLCDTNRDGIADKSCDHCTDDDAFCELFVEGDDCNDNNMNVYPDNAENCYDGVDNNCNRLIDMHEDSCPPTNDLCSTPVELNMSGQYYGTTRNTNNNYRASCAGDTSKDVIYAFTLTQPQDIEIRVSGIKGYLSLRTSCTNNNSEIACVEGDLFLFNLQTGTYYLVLESTQEENFILDFMLETATETPENDTCEYAQEIDVGTIIGTTYASNDNTAATCATQNSRDVFYLINLQQPQDVIVTAQSTTPGSQAPNVEIRSVCNDSKTAIICGSGANNIRGYSIPAGPVYIVVESEGLGGEFELTVTLEDPTPVINLGSNSTCESPTIIDRSYLVSGSFSDNNTVRLSCGLSNNADVVMQLNLQEDQDIVVNLIDGTIYKGGLQSTCGDLNTDLSCVTSFPMNLLGLTQGTYYLILEKGSSTTAPNDFLVEIQFREPTPSFNVSNNDDCSYAYEIGVSKAVYRGSTKSLADNYQGTCANSRSNDAIFHLPITKVSNVVLDLSGSSYDTVLYVRSGQCDSGTQVDCNDDYRGSQSYLEFVGSEALNPGDYYIFVDGYGTTSSGNYQLYVNVTAQ